MIHFDHADSPFYESNKKYCLQFEEKLRSRNIECKGFCTAYGFDIEAFFSKDGLEYRTNVHKFQTSRGGEIVPVNAVDDGSTEIMVRGLDKKYRLTAGRSKLLRLFTSSDYKKNLPEPYYLFGLNPQAATVTAIGNIIHNYRLLRLRVGGGELHCKIITYRADPLILISTLDALVAEWQ